MAERDRFGLPKRGHGSQYSYQYERCRCDACRRANATHHRNLMTRYKQTGPRGTHGTTYCYDTGCRCDPCREAHNLKSREYKRSRRNA